MKNKTLRLTDGVTALFMAVSPLEMTYKLFQLQEHSRELVLEVKNLMTNNVASYTAPPSYLLILLALATGDDRFQIDSEQEFVSQETIEDLRSKLNGDDF